jgi:hypothetical protein
MKQTQAPLQADKNENYANKLWTCIKINESFIFKIGPGARQFIRNKVKLRGQTLILGIFPESNYTNDFVNTRLEIQLNKRPDNQDWFPLYCYSSLQLEQGGINWYKFEGFEEYSLVARVFGLEEHFDVKLIEIIIDQTEDFDPVFQLSAIPT